MKSRKRKRHNQCRNWWRKYVFNLKAANGGNINNGGVINGCGRRLASIEM
jgi:hypothetical protein